MGSKQVLLGNIARENIQGPFHSQSMSVSTATGAVSISPITGMELLALATTHLLSPSSRLSEDATTTLMTHDS